MFRGKRCYDGGLTNFIPLPPTQHGVRVCCFPSKQITTIYDIGISPDNYEDWPHTLQEMLSWAFEPADDKLLLEFISEPLNMSQSALLFSMYHNVLARMTKTQSTCVTFVDVRTIATRLPANRQLVLKIADWSVTLRCFTEHHGFVIFLPALIACSAHEGKGRADAKAWAKVSGALAVVQPGAEQDATARADEQSEDYEDLEETHPKSDPVKSIPEAAVVQGKAVSTKADSTNNES